MIRPASLTLGDKIGVVATGRKILRDDVLKAGETFRSWGLTVEFGENIFNNEHPYLAASDEHRFGDLQQMLDRDDIKAIVCARGGYGTTRILDLLNFAGFCKNPKWIAGFSDVTALHLKIFTLGIESIHSTMPILFAKAGSAGAIESIKEIMFGAGRSIDAPFNEKNKPGTATGMVLGGNLSLLTDALATSSEPATAANILVLEEVGEDLYRVDRMLTHLKRAGKLEKLAGLVIGHMTNIADVPEGFGETVEDIILDKVAEFDYPVAFSFPIGHDFPNIAWRHGAMVKLTVSEDSSLFQYLADPR